jgi:hypothetical protein
VKKNRRGQVMLFGLMMALMTFLFALAVIPSLKGVIGESRDAVHLDCANESISTGQAGTCLVVDLYLPALILAILVGGLTWVGARAASGGI